ncbi:MAG: hypothetical protein ACK5KT_06970 [Dysgonomonas sp.]
MLRYYSHYTFIYPDTYLRNYIIETDGEGHIVRVFPFESEVEKTEFYSGLLIFLPTTEIYMKKDIYNIIFNNDFAKNNIQDISSYTKYNFYHEEDFAM